MENDEEVYLTRADKFAAQAEEAKAAVAATVEVDDIDAGAWLSADDSALTGKVRVRAGMLTIAALTEKEMQRIQKGAQKPDPSKGKRGTQFDAMLFKQLIVCNSLSKASGLVVTPDQLANKLAGEVVKVADAITELSGYNATDSDKVGEVFD